MGFISYYCNYTEKQVNSIIGKHAIFSGKVASFNRNGTDLDYVNLRILFGDLSGEGSTSKYFWYTRKVDQLCNVYIEKLK